MNKHSFELRAVSVEMYLVYIFFFCLLTFMFDGCFLLALVTV